MTKPYLDAVPEVAYMHIQQLKSVLHDNADVISVVQTGFIGSWGEWYYTTNYAGYTPGDIQEHHWVARKRIVTELLDALTPDRMIQLRTPFYKMQLFNTQIPLDSSESFSGTNYSRVGHHNDCFVASVNDWGTYYNPEIDKPYLEKETLHVPMGGETCNVSPPYSDCLNATGDLERFHWSYLNIDYHKDVLTEWSTQGCYDEVERSLGYRFVLDQATITNTTAPSGDFSLDLQLRNVGYSSPYNKRNVEIILKNEVSNEEYTLPVDEDPRHWHADSTINFSVHAGIPADIIEGTYTVYLKLADPYLSLANDPRYSIQLANENIWNSTLGYNNLGVSVSINSTNTSTPYNGLDIFYSTAQKSIQTGPNKLFGGSGEGMNTIFWSAVDSLDRIVERSVNGSPFSPLTTLKGTVNFFKDSDIIVGNTYSYRYKLVSNKTETDYSNQIDIIGSDVTSIQITVDGDDADWNNISPINSVTVNGNQGFILRSYFDLTNANFLLYGNSITEYQVFFDIDNNITTGSLDENINKGMDYVFRNDSLFKRSNITWEFVEKFTTITRTDTLIEFSIPLSSMPELGFNPNIPLYSLINSGLARISASEFTPDRIFRTPPPDLPTSMYITSYYEFKTRLDIMWDKCLYCDGYILENSTDSINFIELGSYPLTLDKITHTPLITGQTYYYRIKTYNKLGLSDYTSIYSGVPGQSPVATFPEGKSLNMYPNPADCCLQLNFQPESLIIYSASGKRLYNYTVEGE
ncbi:MAG: DUF4832 domain-containing protein, partial [Cyclobacteriaceae bacterium]|nr:DUF4832 domain-containing protein [Cyclobacteriaceae bacterium]